MVARRVLSVVAALLLTVLGQLALFSGGVANYRAVAQFAAGGVEPGAIVLMLLGMLLLAAAAATVAISSAGAIVVGVIHVAWGLLVVLLPFDPMGGFRSPFMDAMLGLRPVLPDISDGLFFFVPTGFGIVVGTILLGSGIAARGRTAIAGSGLARAVAAIAAAVAVPSGLVLVLIGGAMIYRAQLQALSGVVDVAGVLFVLLGAVLIAAAVVAVRWSSIGVVAIGVVVTVVGIVFVVQPQLVAGVYAVSRELATGLQLAAAVGNVAAVGAVLAGAGLGAKWRARRASVAADEPIGVSAPTGAVYDD